MKFNYVLLRSLALASLILITSSLGAQNSDKIASLSCQPIELSEVSYLEEELNSYKVFESDIAVSRLNLKNNFKFTLPIEGLNFELNIFNDNITVTDNLPHDIYFLGGTEQSGGQASLTIADGFMAGYIIMGDVKYYIQPLTYFNKEAKSDQYVCYSEHEIKESSKVHKCGHSLKTKIEDRLSNKSVVSECRIMNIAIANTYDMLVKYGSEQAVINHNLAILNNVQTDYRSEFDVNIEFNLSGHYIASSPALDPFENDQSSTNASLLLPAFRDWASDGSGGLPGGTEGGFGAAFDLAAVWTDRDLHQDGGDIIGLAYTPGWFQILQDYSSTLPRLQVLMTHETGHNLGAAHDASGNGTIMAPATTVTSNWSATSISQIDNYFNNLVYLPACHTQGAPTSYFFQTSKVICQNSFLGFEDQSKYGVTSQWTFNGSSTPSSSEPKPQVSFNQLGYNIVSLTSTNNAGSDSHSSYVLVVEEPFVNCTPADDLSTGGISNLTFSNVNHNTNLANIAGSYENNICAGVVNLEPGVSQDLRITLAGVTYITFFFDYNGDGDFNDTGESPGVYSIPNDGTYLVPVTTSSNPLMNTLLRMRIITSNEQITSTCAAPAIGQIEDYGMFFGTPQVLGCTDPSSDNYNPAATIDDGSCSNGGSSISTWYEDLDNDTYGNPSVSTQASAQPAGYVADNSDCDDNNPNINPAASELCDGIDNNCNGQTDEGVAMNTYYEDNDGDSYGSSNSMTACSQPSGYVANNNDCDDTDPNIHPDATELCDGIDNNCNGQTDEGVNNRTYYIDNDEDGYGSPDTEIEACTQPDGYVTNASDCDDNNPLINPAQPELCDGIDNNCNNQADEGVNNLTYYIDNDEDGYGSPDTEIEACTQPDGYVTNASDCDDNNPLINPAQPELCDGIDNNCNNQADEGTDTNIYYLDSDGDGYGSANSIEACAQPEGYVVNNSDCDDNNPLVNPGQAELCDGIDNNCNNQADEETTVTTYYLDSDRDGYGDVAVSIESCDFPAGYVENSSDCDDSDASINPGQSELCDGIDNNCSGQIDEGLTDEVYYLDNDGDGYGNDSNSLTDCTPPNGYVLRAGDCNDDNPEVHPDAEEACDDIDNNCNGEVDEDACSMISGVVYEDSNGNSLKDASEPGVEGIRIILEYSGKSLFEETITDSNGYYEFSNLIEGGEYYMVYDISSIPENMIVVYDEELLTISQDKNSLATNLFTVTDDELEIPFISVYTAGEIHGSYFTEVAGSPIENWAYLYNKEYNLAIDSVYTTNGSYSFQMLEVGNYYIEFIAPIEGLFLTTAQTNNSTINNSFMDNDLNAMIGQTSSIDITPGDSISEVNAVIAEGLQTLALENELKLSARWDEKDEVVRLEWQIENLNSSNEVVLERSTRANTGFEEIQSYLDLESLPSGQEDDPGLSDIYYYRLVSYQKDGSKPIHSNLVSVQTGYKLEAILAPNPAKKEVRIILSDIVHDIEITITDEEGKSFNSEINRLDDHSFRINLDPIPSGIYYLNIRSEKSFKSEKLVVLK